MKDKELMEFWRTMKPPIRPSKDMLAIYDTNINRLGLNVEGAWGLLGCTPELRSLAGKYHRPLTCIDINPQAYTAFKPLCDPSEQEEFLHSDWLEADLPQAFDLVLAEGSMIMLPTERHQGFFDSIYRMLKPGGYVMVKAMLSDDSFSSAVEVLRYYRQNPLEIFPTTSLRIDLSLLTRNRETQTIDRHNFACTLEELYKDRTLTEVEYLELKSCPMDVNLYCTSKVHIEHMLEGRFEILSIEVPNDFMCGRYFPIYLLRKK